MTEKELREERVWIMSHRHHPDYAKRVEEFNNLLRAKRKELAAEKKVKAKEFNPGEIVKVNHHKVNGMGFFKVVRVKISMVVLKNLANQKNYNVQSTLIEKIEKEDSDLISSLDEIGL
jgi:hypothetical protein